MDQRFFRSLFSFVLAFTLASSSFATGVDSVDKIASAPISSDAVSGPGSASVLEERVEAELDRQATVVFTEFKKVNPSADIPVLQRAKKLAMYRIKQMGVITDVLKSAGRAPAISIVATEILTTCLAPVFVSLGWHGAASAMLGLPWGLVAGGGAFYFLVLKERLKIARGLGLYSLSSLDLIRETVIGYNLKYRVSSIIHDDLEAKLGRADVEVLRRSINFEKSNSPSVTVGELEAMVRRSPEGLAYLQQTYMDRLDTAYYASLLLRFVSSDEALAGELVEKLQARSPEFKSSASLRRHLLNSHDVSLKIAREIKKAQIQKSNLKKRKKAGEITADEVKALKKEYAAEIMRLGSVRAELVRHEYGVLFEAKRQVAQKIALVDVQLTAAHHEELISIVKQIRETLVAIDKTETASTLPKSTKPNPARRAAVVMTCAELFN